MNLTHLRNLLKFQWNNSKVLLFLLIFLIVSCRGLKKEPLAFNPIPLSTGQWVEYIKQDIPYDTFHIKFTVLRIDDKGFSLETDYISEEETLKIISFHNIENNYTIDTFAVQYNNEKPYKFIPPNGNFIFTSPIPNLFIWSEQIDTTDWKTIICNNKQFNVFTIITNNDTIYYSSEIPIFNIAKMFINNEYLYIYNYGNKGGKSLFTEKPSLIIAGKNLPEEFKNLIKP